MADSQNKNLKALNPIIIDELEFNFIKASGKGGQNVNKVSSKVQLKWKVDDSLIFSDWQKYRIKEFLKNKINKEGFVLLESEEYRSQSKNREAAIQKLIELVKKALAYEKPRKKTKPTKSSQEKRIKEKKEKSQKKQSRQKLKNVW